MFNFQKLVADADDMWNSSQERLCNQLFENLSALTSLSNQRSQTAKSGKGSALPGIPENAQPPILEGAQSLVPLGYLITELSTVGTFRP